MFLIDLKSPKIRKFNGGEVGKNLGFKKLGHFNSDLNCLFWSSNYHQISKLDVKNNNIESFMIFESDFLQKNSPINKRVLGTRNEEIVAICDIRGESYICYHCRKRNITNLFKVKDCAKNCKKYFLKNKNSF